MISMAFLIDPIRRTGCPISSLQNIETMFSDVQSQRRVPHTLIVPLDRAKDKQAEKSNESTEMFFSLDLDVRSRLSTQMPLLGISQRTTEGERGRGAPRRGFLFAESGQAKSLSVNDVEGEATGETEKICLCFSQPVVCLRLMLDQMLAVVVVHTSGMTSPFD